MENSVQNRVEQVLEEIRGAIQGDGGDVEFVSYDDLTKVVYVALMGSCVGCPASTMTLKMGVERAVKSRIPEVAAVEAYE